MLMLALAGCGQAKPTAEDAKAYVQATLDLLCTGDYDHSVDLADDFLALTADEQQDIVLRALSEFLIGKLDTPTYGDPTEVVLHYGLLDEENNIYGCDEDQGELFGSKAFSFD
jgi:hypothetical protein